MNQTVEELSASLAQVIGRFEAQEMGVTATRVSVVIQGDLVLVHLKGVLSPSERDLAQTQEGQAILQRFNNMLFGAGSPSIREQVAASVGKPVVEVQTTLSPLTGSLVVLFTLETEETAAGPISPVASAGTAQTWLEGR